MTLKIRRELVFSTLSYIGRYLTSFSIYQSNDDRAIDLVIGGFSISLGKIMRFASCRFWPDRLPETEMQASTQETRFCVLDNVLKSKKKLVWLLGSVLLVCVWSVTFPSIVKVWGTRAIRQNQKTM